MLQAAGHHVEAVEYPILAGTIGPLGARRQTTGEKVALLPLTATHRSNNLSEMQHPSAYFLAFNLTKINMHSYIYITYELIFLNMQL